MSFSFSGNSGNSGNAGNTTSAAGGWFFPDPIDLPFVTDVDNGVAVAKQRVQLASFPARA
jgi:hypothetical protein